MTDESTQEFKRLYGEYLKGTRKNRGLTIIELSELSGVSNPYISQIENNKFKPSKEILVKLADALEVNTLRMLFEFGYVDLGADPIESGLYEMMAGLIASKDTTKEKKEVGKGLKSLFETIEHQDIADYLKTSKEITFNGMSIADKEKDMIYDFIELLIRHRGIN